MNNTTGAKRQARVMIVTVALIATIATVLILFSVSQHRRSAEPEITSADVTSAHSAHTMMPETKADVPQQKDESRPAETKKPQTEAAATGEDTAQPVARVDVLPEFIAPLSGLLSKSHSVDVPVYSLTMEDYRTHTGVDIAAAPGTAVRAAADGTVEEIWEDPMMGGCLSIVHSGGAKSVYRNLADELSEGLAVGEAVKAGAILGAVGESALAEIAEESHLHYELYIDGVSVDPADFMLFGTTDISYES